MVLRSLTQHVDDELLAELLIKDTGFAVSIIMLTSQYTQNFNSQNSILVKAICIRSPSSSTSDSCMKSAYSVHA